MDFHSMSSPGIWLRDCRSGFAEVVNEVHRRKSQNERENAGDPHNFVRAL